MAGTGALLLAGVIVTVLGLFEAGLDPTPNFASFLGLVGIVGFALLVAGLAVDASKVLP